MRGRVAILHHRRSFFAPELADAIGSDFELVWGLVDDEYETGNIRLLRHLGEVVEIDSRDLDEAAARLGDLGVDGIVTFVDDRVVLAAELAARLDLPYHTPEVAETVVNKLRQRAVFAAAGLPEPDYWPLPAGLTFAAVDAIAAGASYPAVLKHTQNSGSRGIVPVASADELSTAYDPDCEYILESYMYDDPKADPRFASYLSVESVISAAGVSHAALTGRFALASDYRETGNFIPAAVDAATGQTVLSLAESAIAALELGPSVVHTEVKLTPEGPRLIEINGRLAGRPPFVLRSVSSQNLFRTACRLAVGEPIQLDGLASCDGIGYYRMLQPPAGARQVIDVAGVGSIRALDGVDTVIVNRGAGQPIDQLAGTDSPVVTVRGRAPSLDKLAETIALLDEQVQITYEL